MSARTTVGNGENQNIEVVEEQLRVGKREVEGSGGVRVRSRIVETPVEQEVQLRDETVHVERRPVDRAADAGALSAFKEGHGRGSRDQRGGRGREDGACCSRRSPSPRSRAPAPRRSATPCAARRSTSSRSGPSTPRAFAMTTTAATSSSGGAYEAYDDAYRLRPHLGDEPDYGRPRLGRGRAADAQQLGARQSESTWEKVKDAVRSSWDEGRSSRRS